MNRQPVLGGLEDAVNGARARLQPLASEVVYLPLTGSTNDVAASYAGSQDEGLVVIADEQTAGRGRRGREWFSAPGSGLFVSVVLRPGRAADPARATGLLTLTVGVALAEGIREATGLVVDVKWPNDLYVGARKLGGILAEAAGGAESAPRVVVGFGINVHETAYPPALRDRATSIESELGRRVDRATVLVESLASLARRYRELLAGGFDAILAAWRSRAPAAVGARVTWASPTGNVTGVTAGIDDRGALLVRVGDRTERIIAGEVLWS